MEYFGEGQFFIKDNLKLQYNEIISVVDENDRNWSKHDFGWPSNYGEDKDYEVHKTFTQAIKKLEDSLQ